MLPKYHKLSGHDVSIIASLVTFDSNGAACLKESASEYINEYGIPVYRIDYKRPFRKINQQLRRYESWFEYLEKIKPEIIFIHGCQFVDIKIVVKYVEKYNNVKIYIDNHADYSNSATNWFSKNFLHKILWRKSAQLIAKYTEKFYGVLPARVDFLIDVYGIPSNKVELLVMGADDEKVIEAKTEGVRQNIRMKYGVNTNDFLIMTGGKIDIFKKQTLLLMEAVKNMSKSELKLIVFGSVAENIKKSIVDLCNGKKVQYIGWIDSKDAYMYFAAADLVVFPGRHSVFWEQVVGLGIPMVVKYWEGTTHVDLGGNCKFLYNDSTDEISKVIDEIISNNELYDRMKMVAMTKGMDVFSYNQIAQRSISSM
jgi:Glycosyltransferase